MIKTELLADPQYCSSTSIRTDIDTLSPLLIRILGEARKRSAKLDDTSPSSLEESSLVSMVRVCASELGVDLANSEIDQIVLILEREAKKFGLLQPLIEDSSITDIIVSSFDQISIQSGRRTLKTMLSFSDQAAYERYVERLLYKCGSTFSLKKPFADGIIDNYVRCHAVHGSICNGGPYLTLRIQRFSNVFGEELVNSGLMPELIYRYLQTLICSGKTVLVAGEVGTGKTTLARALSNSIPIDESLLVIEDTPEITLSHPQVRSIVTRGTNSEGEGEISPSQCIRAGMRMSMNRIIFGEIRDPEAAEAFVDVCTSGHPGLSTIHARSASDALKRLELFISRIQRGASQQVIYEQISAAVQVVVYLGVCSLSRTRRVFEVKEIGGVSDGVLRTREIVRYSPRNRIPLWRIVNRSSMHDELLINQPKPISFFDCGEDLTLGDICA